MGPTKWSYAANRSKPCRPPHPYAQPGTGPYNLHKSRSGCSSWLHLCDGLGWARIWPRWCFPRHKCMAFYQRESSPTSHPSCGWVITVPGIQSVFWIRCGSRSWAIIPDQATLFLQSNAGFLHYGPMDVKIGKPAELLSGSPHGRKCPSTLNKCGNYQAFCEEIDHIAAILGCSGQIAEERLFSRGGKSPAPWRAHVLANWPPAPPFPRYSQTALHRRYSHIPAVCF
jgi:hypothetical protein